MESLIGKKWGGYTVVSPTINENDKNRRYYTLKCDDCKREYTRSTRDLNSNNVRVCFCKRYQFIKCDSNASFIVKGKTVLIPNDNDLIRIVEEYGWRLDKDGYVISSYRNAGKIVKVSLHRLIMSYFYGESELSVDHKDRNKLDNTLNNLRYASGVEQQLNRGMHKNNSSGVKGVHFSKSYNLWIARIQKDGKRLQRSFKNFDDAVKQRLEWEGDILT